LQAVQANLDSLKYFCAEFSLVLGILAIILIDRLSQPERRKSLAAAVSLVTLGMALVAILWPRDGGALPLFNGMLAFDPFASFFKLFFVGVTGITVVFALNSSEIAERRVGEFHILLLSLTLGLFLLSSSRNLLMIYVAIEMVSLASYVLVGYKRRDRRSGEAALKYVVYGGAASGVMIYGMSLLYGLFGSLDLGAINQAWQQMVASGSVPKPALVVSIFFILAGLGYKIASVPFHMWCPDAYEGAPTPVTAFLSVGPKAAGFAVMIRFFYTIFVSAESLENGPNALVILGDLPWPAIIGIISVATMTLGNFSALNQTNVKRLLAYSSIAHAGYLLMGFTVVSMDGLRSVMLYLVIYLFMNLGAFLVVMAVRETTGGEEIDDFKGLGSRAPFAAIAMAIFLFSLTGLPPLAGFIGKFYIFAAVLQHGGYFYYLLALIGVINSAISLYYYARIARAMFLDQSPTTERLAVGRLTNGMLSLLALPILALGIYWEPLRTAVVDSLVLLTG